MPKGIYPRTKVMKTGIHIVTSKMKKEMAEIRKKYFQMHPEAREIIAEANRKRIILPSTIEKHREVGKRVNNIQKFQKEHPEWALEHSEAMKKLYQSEEARQKTREGRLRQVFPIKDTKPERVAQQGLTELKIDYTKHKAIFGQPDIFIEPNICIFIDGDYWHNTERGIKRDAEVKKRLEELGYVVYRIWEHEILDKKKPIIKKKVILI